MKTIQKPTKRKTKAIVENKKDKFIDKILDNLSKVKESDWEFYANTEALIPSNLFTNKPYKNFNVLALYIDTMINGFKTSKYATFNSISKAGGKLKKGAKSCVIEFFNFLYKHKETGQKLTKEQFLLLSLEQRKEVEIIPIVRTYSVFNSEFIENINEIDLNIKEEEQEQEEIEDILTCENFISKIIVKGNLNLKFGTNEVAFYSPNRDFVELPKKEFFISTAKYYSTLFHEIIHWTGHKSRLNRNLKGQYDKESYSFEELIAEMGAMLLSLQFGITEEFINSVRYLKSWLNYNFDNKENQLRKAFTESKRAKKFLENI